VIEVDLVVGWICKVFGSAGITWLRVRLDETALAKDRIY